MCVVISGSEQLSYRRKASSSCQWQAQSEQLLQEQLSYRLKGEKEQVDAKRVRGLVHGDRGASAVLHPQTPTESF